ncbi:hypothetical protein FB645_005634 [Coemansia sp. IMI 203386]|nr:hypothetical protein FB645_005634 [Coemansia sp. IMI 203386]
MISPGSATASSTATAAYPPFSHSQPDRRELYAPDALLYEVHHRTHRTPPARLSPSAELSPATPAASVAAHPYTHTKDQQLASMSAQPPMRPAADSASSAPASAPTTSAALTTSAHPAQTMHHPHPPRQPQSLAYDDSEHGYDHAHQAAYFQQHAYQMPPPRAMLAANPPSHQHQQHLQSRHLPQPHSMHPAAPLPARPRHQHLIQHQHQHSMYLHSSYRQPPAAGAEPLLHQATAAAQPQPQPQQPSQTTKGGNNSAGASHHPAPAHLSSPQHHQHQHRPYELQSPAPASRTFWNHYETGLLVQLWLEFEPQFTANKRNAGVWAQLAQRLTERSGRHRTVRECRIKWKNMWAKHRDLANASHMGLEAKLREFPHFTDFAAIRQRSSHQQTGCNDGSEGKLTPAADDRRAALPAAPAALPFAPAAVEEPASVAHYAHSHGNQRAAMSPAVGPVDRWPSGSGRPHVHPDSGAQADPSTGAAAFSGSYAHQAHHQPAHTNSHMYPQQHAYGYSYGYSYSYGHSSSSSHAADQDKQPSMPLPLSKDSAEHQPQLRTDPPSSSSSALHNLLAPLPTHPPEPSHTAAINSADASTSTTAVPDASRHAQGAAKGIHYASLSRSAMSSRAHHSDSQMSIDDIPELLHQLDRSVAAGGESAGYGENNDDASRAALSEDAVVERMRTLAESSSPTAISNAAQQIMGYVERESRRRQLQSERHHRMVAALADILAHTRASSASRRSSGAAHEEWPASGYSSALQHQARINTDTPVNMEADSSETTPTISPAVSPPPENAYDVHASTATTTVAMLSISVSEPGNDDNALTQDAAGEEDAPPRLQPQPDSR